MQKGFTLFYGCMFAGKTSALLQTISASKLPESSILVCKPYIDTRYEQDFVVSHNQIKVAGVRIKKPEEILQHIHSQTQLIAIDELQFFDDDLIDIIKSLQNEIYIVGSGLDKDYLGRPFGIMPDLIKMADTPTLLKALCNQCGKEAEYTYRTIKESSLILTGDKNEYEARCKDCFEF